MTEKLKKYTVNFTMVSNAVLTDAKLSLKAKGLYAYLFSKPNGWLFHNAVILSEIKESVDAFKSAIMELEKAGYIKRETAKNAFGQVEGVNITFIDPSSKNPVEENPVEENPVEENPTPNNTDITKTDSKEKEKIQKKTARKRNAQTLFDETEFYQETIPDSLKEIAAKLNPFQNAQPTYEAFKDYNLQHARKAADWKAAWRNWLRSKYNSNFKDISHVLNREAVKNQMAYLEQMKAQGDEFFIQRARTRLKQIIEQELEK
ncbi:MAG: hypothetical protein KH349_06855 [Clostridium sp.]|nr:hypothetical protein [Clostridium sp.]